jgi:hypothetical protein
MSCPDDSSIEALEAIYEEAALADEADESLTTTEDCARAAEVRDKRSAGRWCMRGPRPTSSSRRFASALALPPLSPPFISIAIATFSSPVSAGNRLKP